MRFSFPWSAKAAADARRREALALAIQADRTGLAVGVVATAHLYAQFLAGEDGPRLNVAEEIRRLRRSSMLETTAAGQRSEVQSAEVPDGPR